MESPEHGGTQRRRALGVKPGCEALDGRQLLSTVAAPVALWGPPPAAVANAAQTVSGLAPRAFAEFQRDLKHAEAHSRVAQSQVDRLAQDESAVTQAIENSDASPESIAQEVDFARFEIDQAFMGMRDNRRLSYIGGLLRFHAINPEGPMTTGASASTNTALSTELVHRTIHDINAVVRAVHVPNRLRLPLANDLAPDGHIGRELGWSLKHEDGRNGNIETAITQTAIYYEGQISKFIR